MKRRLRTALVWIAAALALSGCGDWINYDPLDFYSAPVEFDDSKATRHLEVAAAAIAPDPNDKTVTLDRIEAMARRIKSEHPNVQVIVFGEMILQAYYSAEDRGDYAARMAETIPGPATDRVSALATNLDVALIIGLTERDGGTGALFNSQALLRPDGSLVRYRKQVLNDADRESGMEPGSGNTLVDVEGFRAAMMICSDAQSERVTESVVRAGVDVVLQSLSTSTGHLMDGFNPLGAQFGAWVVFANRYGEEDGHENPGYVLIIDPAGAIRAEAEGNDVYAFYRIGAY